MRFSEVINDTSAVIVEKTTLKASPVLFDARQLPSSLAGNCFCLDIQSKNTNKLRDRNRIRIDHVLRVQMLHRIRPNEQVATQREALEDEERIIDAMVKLTTMPEARVLYRLSLRALVASREFLVTTIEFSVEDTWTMGREVS